MHRCGFIAIVGRPNVGKSSLLNALLDRKVSIVTPKPQTTRHRILGIRSKPDSQVIFVDTPGIHRGAKRAINQMMNRAATASLADADNVLWVVEALRFTGEDEDVLERVRRHSGKIYIVVNKVDRVRRKSDLLPFLEMLAKRIDFTGMFPVSALKRDSLDVLMDELVQGLPESPPMFPAGQVTDRSESFHAAEIIREKLTWLLREELPYGMTVEIERYEDEGGRLAVDAVIWVERASQKAILIGKGGSRLKEIGSAARMDLKARAGRPVHLQLWARVKRNWSDSVAALQSFGYDES